MINTKTIGNKITEARKKISISQAQLAERLFISSQAVGKWERGESMPDITTFARLAEILRVDLNYFSEGFTSKATEEATERPIMKQSDESGSHGMPAGKEEKKLNWNMSEGNWADADFSGLKNLHEKFSSSNLQKCKFVGSDMSGLLLKSNNVDSCDFSGSDISSSTIQKSNLLNNLFKDCTLKETEFSESDIMGCDFSGTDFTGAVFRSGGFQKNTMTNTVLNRTSFNAMQIVDTVFDGILKDCSFENCVFTRITFQNATLTNTFFKGGNLKRVKFVECKVDRLTFAFLKSGQADLSGITLLTP